MDYVNAALAPQRNIGKIKLHEEEAFKHMRLAGKIAAKTLDMITEFVKPGATTNKLDNKCFDFIVSHNATPAPLNYKGFPKSICTSVNHVICHGIPNDKPLEEGDILNIDVTVLKNGWHGDTSRMYYVGKISDKARRLIDTAYISMMESIKEIKPNIKTGKIGSVIQKIAEKENYSVVTEFCGHGLGQVFHDEPNILHFGTPEHGYIIKKGMFFTVEPMINEGEKNMRILADGWTAVTKDKSLSAQFEHSMGVTNDGVEIFTLSPSGLHKPPY